MYNDIFTIYQITGPSCHVIRNYRNNTNMTLNVALSSSSIYDVAEKGKCIVRLCYLDILRRKPYYLKSKNNKSKIK